MFSFRTSIFLPCQYLPQVAQNFRGRYLISIDDSSYFTGWTTSLLVARHPRHLTREQMQPSVRLLRTSACSHPTIPVLGHFPICQIEDWLLSLPQLGEDWLQDTSVTITFLLFTIVDDAWLTESYICNFKPHISISISPVSLFTYYLSSHITLLD